jgi:hypothetical protein
VARQSQHLCLTALPRNIEISGTLARAAVRDRWLGRRDLEMPDDVLLPRERDDMLCVGYWLVSKRLSAAPVAER